jgi:hypothetical protein
VPGLTYPFTFVAKTKAKASEVNANFAAIETLLETTKLGADNIQNNAITEALLAIALQQKLGLGSGGRGKSIIAGEGTRTSSSFGALDGGAAPGPDQIQNIVLPTDGLIRIAYHALWKDAAGGTRRAAIFIGANQLKRATANAAPSVYEVAPTGGGVSQYSTLSTTPDGMSGGYSPTGAAESGAITTGQILAATGQEDGGGDIRPQGGWLTVFAAAGTYDVSVQFRGSATFALTVKERKLWVEAVGF